jgi:hypothetical protein
MRNDRVSDYGMAMNIETNKLILRATLIVGRNLYELKWHRSVSSVS